MSPEYIADVLPYLRKLAKQAKAATDYWWRENTKGYHDFFVSAPDGRVLRDGIQVDAEILRLQNIAAVKRGERVG